MEQSPSWISGALATTTARAKKTSLAIKWMRAFFKLFRFYFLSSLGDRTQFQTQRRNRSCPCVNVVQTTSQKEIYGRVRTGGKEKRAGRAKFVFHLLIGLIAVVVTSAFVVAPRIYGYGSENVFSKNACHLFSRYICYSRFGPLMNCSVSLETDIWVERKKK